MGAVPEAVSYNVYRSHRLLPNRPMFSGGYHHRRLHRYRCHGESHAWYYVVTAVDGSSSESEPSNRVGSRSGAAGVEPARLAAAAGDTTLDAVLGDQLYGTR